MKNNIIKKGHQKGAQVVRSRGEVWCGWDYWILKLDLSNHCLYLLRQLTSLSSVSHFCFVSNSPSVCFPLC